MKKCFEKTAGFLRKLKKHWRLFLVFLLAFAAFYLLSLALNRRNRDVIAIVDGYRITVGDLLAELEDSPGFYRESVEDNPERLLNSYINQILLYRKAKKYERKYRGEIKAGLKNYYIKALTEKFVENEVAGSIKIEDGIIAEYYNNNLEDFVIPAKVRISEIVLHDRQKAEEVLRRLRYGESFESIAKKESVSESSARSGDLGWIDVRKLDDEIFSMVTRINPGEILKNIVRTELGYHIIKLVGKTERRILTLGEATPSIINILMAQEKKREVDLIISREREKSKIKIFKEKTGLIKERLE